MGSATKSSEQIMEGAWQKFDEAIPGIFSIQLGSVHMGDRSLKNEATNRVGQLLPFAMQMRSLL
jgi:hypothetical protein